MAARKLRHYFESHRIVVVTSQPLHELFNNKEASGRISKWALELSGYVVDFEKRSAIKSQVLADFIANWTSPSSSGSSEQEKSWIVHCDGAYCHKGAGVSAVLASPSGIKIRFAARLDFPQGERATNNTTEYEALLLALRKMKALGHQVFIVKSDSKVIQGHVEKESEAREPELVKYLAAVRAMEKHFKGFTVEHIRRSYNNEVDALAKVAAQNQQLPPDVFYEVLATPSVKEKATKMVNIIERHDWRAPILAYLRGHFEPIDEKDLNRMKQRARAYEIVDGELYKAGISTPWLQCISFEAGEQLLNEIHKGFCGAHIGSSALAQKALRQGFYWPSIINDAFKLVKTCEACQKNAINQRNPSMPI